VERFFNVLDKILSETRKTAERTFVRSVTAAV
jgi:hypothetical protein